MPSGPSHSFRRKVDAIKKISIYSPIMIGLKDYRINIGVVSALAAASLFGISTPLAKNLLGEIDPFLLAGLLYLGSGLGLLVWAICSGRFTLSSIAQRNYITLQNFLWLCGAILAGGILGPLLLMTGLKTTPATFTSLLLNLEGVFTALLAWFVFKENFDRRIFIGMIFIVCGGVLLSWSGDSDFQIRIGILWIIGACLAWAIDNNLTRKISESDAVGIAAIKGLVAGIINTLAALALGAKWPQFGVVLAAGTIGLMSYGISLVLFVVALRHLGTARTAAYFSTGPFIGAAASIAFLGESVAALFWLATVLMGIGVWLHLSERHGHLHAHEPIVHTHPHEHDGHHQHEHSFPWDKELSHSHQHQHKPVVHGHTHYPDIHHRHYH